jgi:hypothetical protein
MMNRFRVIVLALALAGCGCTKTPAPATTPELSGSQGSSQGISWTMRGHGDVKSIAKPDGFEASIGQNKLEVKGDKLYFNGKEYGTVKSGDEIVLDENGTLTVNGEKREPPK